MAVVKVINRSTWPDRFVRRAIAWCAREIGLPLRHVAQVRVGTLKRGAWSGTAWPGAFQHRIRCLIGPAAAYPISVRRSCRIGVRDRTEGLIHTLAHELAHVAQFATGAIASEFGAERYADAVLAKFRRHRRRLIAQWGGEDG